MIILGINAAHNATVCLLKNGKILACVSEERLTRVKNQHGVPYLAIKDCLKIAGITMDEVNYIALNHLDPKVHMGFTTLLTDKNRDAALLLSQSIFQKLLSFLWNIKTYILLTFPQSKSIIDLALDIFYRLFIDKKTKERLYRNLEANLGIGRNKILLIDHHLTHGYSAYFSSPFNKNKPVLVFTADSSGDKLCATVSIAKGGKLNKIASTPSGNSIGDLYMHTTAYLGMKPVEHEYKVMGLAPYSNSEHYSKLYHKMKKFIWVNPDLTFGSKIHSHMYYKIVPKLYAYERFDNIAASVQKLTEDLLCEWVKLTIQKTGIRNVVCGGGTFMNVKANQAISELAEAENMYIMPSAGDESTAIGAAFFAYQQIRESYPDLDDITPLEDLYLGGNFSDSDIERELSKRQYKFLKIERPKNLEARVAKLLADFQIVARFAGKMEWGARALGNRSILANPSSLDVITELNEKIKSRDFWMPFAGSVLDENKDKYFINKKNIQAPYMIITFKTTVLGQKLLKAAIHQYDQTIRPQIVYKKWNPTYYKLIKEFKKLTGIGAVLNTSFNLHGYPIVYSPEDALYVFKNSGLKFLALGPYLISKPITF